ncbi:MAG: sigma-70 family RNA polymerase sigma factor [Chitinophagaceae bacterium]
MKALISALKYCDGEEAFQEIFLLTKGKVYAYFLKKTNSADDAKDLTQNVYFRLWKYRKKVNEDISLDQHLFQYAKQVYIDYLKSRKSTSYVPDIRSMENNNAFLGQPDGIFDRMEKEKIFGYLQSEPPLNQHIFILNKWEGYSYQQLSEMFSLSVKSIDNYINKTMKRLKKKIGF